MNVVFSLFCGLRAAVRLHRHTFQMTSTKMDFITTHTHYTQFTVYTIDYILYLSIYSIMVLNGREIMELIIEFTQKIDKHESQACFTLA